MKQIVVRPAAAADIEEAYEWYERQRPGLGEEFLAALRSTLDRVVAQPEAFTVIHRATRRALVPQRFPYALFYSDLQRHDRRGRMHARRATPATMAAAFVMANPAPQRTGLHPAADRARQRACRGARFVAHSKA